MKMISFLYKVYQRLLLVCAMIFARLMLYAQEDFDDDDVKPSLMPDFMGGEEDEEFMDNIGFHLSTTDLILLGCLVIAYFILHQLKIKKGCWYIIFYCVIVFLLITKCT